VLTAAGESIARSFVDRLVESCLKLDDFPARGTVRDEIRPGLRIIGYRRQASIAFVVGEADVVILRIFRRGQDVHAALSNPDNDDLS
jgi:toxin ParE1/3/4